MKHPRSHADQKEAVRLFVEEGIRDVHELAERTGYSAQYLYRLLRNSNARDDYRSRVEKARTLYCDMNVRDPKTLSSMTGLSKNVLQNEIFNPSESDNAPQRIVPTLQTAGELIRTAAERLLRDVAERGFENDMVKNWMMLANAYEQFNTGEYLLEMILVGIEAFAAFVREKAKSEGMNPEHVALLIALLEAFRKEKVDQLRLQTHANEDDHS